VKVLVCAGEPSGDRHAAAVVRALRSRIQTIEVVGVGGAALEREGGRLLAHVEELSAMGLAEAAHTLPRHVRLLRALERELQTGGYDLTILVDYPGFHIRVAARAARCGVPVLYYVAPQLWAWGSWRIERLRRSVQRLAVVLPFEETFFSERGIPTTFVGHPLLDREALPDRSSARRALGLSDSQPVVAVFPGSRPSEVARMLPVFRATVERLGEATEGLTALVAEQAPQTARGTRWADDVDAPLALAAADVGLIKSGTATLEAALAGLPMVVAYRMHPLTFTMARRLVRVPYVSLVNLVTDEPLVPEFLQRRAEPVGLALALQELLTDPRARNRQLSAFRGLRTRLGTPGAADRVADLAMELAA